jgi:hypothetical protein
MARRCFEIVVSLLRLASCGTHLYAFDSGVESCLRWPHGRWGIRPVLVNNPTLVQGPLWLSAASVLLFSAFSGPICLLENSFVAIELILSPFSQALNLFAADNAAVFAVPQLCVRLSCQRCEPRIYHQDCVEKYLKVRLASGRLPTQSCWAGRRHWLC